MVCLMVLAQSVQKRSVFIRFLRPGLLVVPRISGEGFLLVLELTSPGLDLLPDFRF